jgi:hypothetical protein
MGIAVIGIFELLVLLCVAAVFIGIPIIILIVVLFVSRSSRNGSNSEVDELRKENARLRAELDQRKHS